MSGDRGDGGYSLTEIFAIKFVLADVIIVAALLFAGPLYAVAITALLVVSVFLVWYLTERVGGADEPARESVDPVTELQRRYAAGELSEAEFETKLERLLDADERAERANLETRELSLERDRS
ncbi:SHOCT domain-containing protein [Natronococcus sp. JC468]|uniref:SHOCT domain-containing protein n=1 Tax=Natronococcus sp. JC468 TaxID=1961921 RepID=UPI00143A20F3|nr:SHOCT domain-containing protein [Natronococcus sp. JC468]NKE35043.1 SHOCT domain-containing protein [Natronococcus sp. JC468]